MVLLLIVIYVRLKNWLGRFSTIEQIRNGKLWLSQYLTAEILTEQDKEAIAHTITDTKEKISRINESVYPK